MDIPDKLKIGPLVYNVIFSPDISNGGEIDAEKQEIKINSNQTKEYRELALWHEIIHAINSEFNEREAEYLAQAIYQVLKENKNL